MSPRTGRRTRPSNDTERRTHTSQTKRNDREDEDRVRTLQSTLGNQATQAVVTNATGQVLPDGGRTQDMCVPADQPRNGMCVPAGQTSDGMCVPAGSNRPVPGSQAVFDYEQQVCRPPTPAERNASAPQSSPVDGEFWTVPPSIRRRDLDPVYDDETGAVVGFRYESGGYWEVYDLEGNMVSAGEKGLEKPLIDPIDIVAGGLVGLGRSLFGGGLRGVARGTAGGLGRGTAASAGRTGLLVSIKILSTRAATSLRGVYRAIKFRGTLNFTATTAARMADSARRVPRHILKLALKYGKRSPDPQGTPGAAQYVIQMFRNGKEYTLEVVVREADNTILHFLYK